MVSSTATEDGASMVFNLMLQIECKQADKCNAAGKLMLLAQASSQADEVGDCVEMRGR